MKQRLISIPFFLLRTTTAGAALLTGLLQTYVFAHVLSPQRSPSSSWSQPSAIRCG